MRFPEDWSETRKVYESWWAHELERPVVQVFYPPEDAGPGTPFDSWSFLKYKNDPDALHSLLETFPETERYAGDAFPSLFVNLGPGVLAAYFSGYLGFDDFNNTAWFEKSRPWDEVEGFTFTDDNEWWQYTQFATQMCAEAAKDRFIVGMTDIGGMLDVLAALRGTENLLMDLVAQPERVNQMRRRILDAWHQAHDSLNAVIARVQQGTSSWVRIWCPSTYYPLQCDFCAMISPGMFETFVAPDVREQCQRLGHGLFHLDGPGQLPHVDLLLDIPELDGIQWVPGSGNPQCDSPQYFPMYEKILGKGKSLVLQTFDDWRNIPRILEALPGKGMLFSVTVASKKEARELLNAFEMPISEEP